MFFDHIVTGIRVQNIEFQYQINLEANNSYTGIAKDDVTVLAELYGRNSDNGDWKLVNSKTKEKRYRRSVSCSQNDVFDVVFNRGESLQNPFKTKVYICKPIVVFQQRSLEYSQYRASISFANLGPMYEMGLFTGRANSTVRVHFFYVCVLVCWCVWGYLIFVGVGDGFLMCLNACMK